MFYKNQLINLKLVNLNIKTLSLFKKCIFNNLFFKSRNNIYDFKKFNKIITIVVSKFILNFHFLIIK